MEKTCPGCCTTKNDDQFYISKTTKDGLSFYCKSCQRKKRMEYYQNGGKEKQAENFRVYFQNPENREKKNAYFREYSKKRRVDSRVKWLANTAVNTSVELGEIKSPEKCELCKKETRLHAHHWHGYAPSKWLDVLWLCPACHAYQHKIIRQNQPVQIN